MQRGARAFAVFGLSLVSSCALARPDPPPPVAPAASRAMAAAQEAWRAASRSDASRPQNAARAEARAACERALEHEPGWIAPQRLLDEIAREELVGVATLAARRARADAIGGAAELYLAGRLEGAAAALRFERAAELDPDCAWAWHGLAYSAIANGEVRTATGHAKRALALARDPWEACFFTAALARLEIAAGDVEEALERLDERAAAASTAPADRAALAAQSALARLDQLGHEDEGVELALDLVRGASIPEAELTDAELAALVKALRRRASAIGPARIEAAIAARAGALRDRVRGELLLERGSPLAAPLFERAGELADFAPLAPGALRAAGFWAGDARGAVRRWLAELPDVARSADGLPNRAALRAAAEFALALPESPAPAQLAELGQLALAAGWLSEASAVAARLAAHDATAALALEARAAAGRAVLERLDRALRALDRGEVRFAALAAGDLGDRDANDVDAGLGALVATLAPDLAALGALEGTDGDLARVRAELARSPRITYGSLAEVVHPGPRFSSDDEKAELGRAGEDVGGLARALAHLGRFGLFGELYGAPPDATVLPLLAEESRAGEFLGTRFAGSVAWCERADVESRAARAGASVAGAALHEGFWIDVDEVRGERAAWQALEEEFAREPERVQAVLAQDGLACERGEDGARERTATNALLGEASRVRLAVLAERGARAAERGALAAERAALGTVALDELLQVAAAHEEGHLVDRALHLPIGAHLGRAFLLLLRAGFSGRGVAEELELRAQLMALARVPEPRIVLAQILDATESGIGLTAHAAAYARLLDDVLRELDLRVQAGRIPALSPDRTLAHQLHGLGAEDLRAVALALARRRIP